MMSLCAISASVQEGKTMQTEAFVSRALKEKLEPNDILRGGLITGMMETERRFQKNEILDSELMLAKRAMKAGMRIVMPLIKNSQCIFSGTVITGTLEGDIRDTEKDIISCLMQSLCLRVIDLGTSVPGIRFIEAAIKEKAQLIVCSTALTIFLPKMKSLVQAAARAGIRSKTKILLSGRPVTEWFCKSIDADMYAPDAILAADMAAEHCKRAVR